MVMCLLSKTLDVLLPDSAERLVCRTLVVLILTLGTAHCVAAGENEPESLLVGIRPHPPFVILDDGEPKGFSIDLWKAVAGEMNIRYYLIRSGQISGVLEDLTQDRVDAAIGGIAITEDRERSFDFTHSYFITGLGILVGKQKNWSVIRLFKSLLHKNRIMVLLFFGGFILISGHLIWVAERMQPENKRSFSRKYLPGILEGMYWTIVTASTVGYGDRVPRSWAGRVLATLLIIISLPLFAFFIAKLSSDITLHELRTSISRPQDLIERRVGVLENSTSHAYVSRLNALAYTFDNIENAYDWLMKGRLDAVVYDRPNLQYFAQNRGKGRVEVVGNTFSSQDYAIATPQGSHLRERFNRVLLSLIEQGRVEDIRKKWFGSE